MNASKIMQELRAVASPEKALLLARFFKTGKGEYGEGDRFLGVMVPAERAIARRYRDLALPEVAKLLASPYHEVRLTGLLILTYAYGKAGTPERGRIYRFFLACRKHVNNWDLVDVTVPRIVGAYMVEHPKERERLYRLVKSKSVWERRIALLSTFAFIARDDFADSLRLAEMLLFDSHDLIHKALGWMLREIGKRDGTVLHAFLDAHATSMPRTALRYAIERFPETERKAYLSARQV